MAYLQTSFTVSTQSLLELLRDSVRLTLLITLASRDVTLSLSSLSGRPEMEIEKKKPSTDYQQT